MFSCRSLSGKLPKNTGHPMVETSERFFLNKTRHPMVETSERFFLNKAVAMKCQKQLSGGVL